MQSVLHVCTLQLCIVLIAVKFVKVIVVELKYFDEFEYLGHTISNDG